MSKEQTNQLPKIHCPICNGVETFSGFHGCDVDYTNSSMGEWIYERGDVNFLESDSNKQPTEQVTKKYITIVNSLMYLRDFTKVKDNHGKIEGILPINYCPICGKRLRKKNYLNKKIFGFQNYHYKKYYDELRRKI